MTGLKAFSNQRRYETPLGSVW